MSVLVKREILEKIANGEIVIKPEIDSFQLQAHAVDLRLGYTFMIPKSWKLTAKGRESLHMDHYSTSSDKNLFDIVELEKGQFFELLPGEHVMASSLESITLPDDLMSVLYPRSSTSRRGLSVDLTGIIDSGYEGQLMIPIRNNTSSQSIKLYPGERFCQITFEKLSEPSQKPKGTYHQKDIIEGFVISDKNKQESEYILSGNILELKKDYKVLPDAE